MANRLMLVVLTVWFSLCATSAHAEPQISDGEKTLPMPGESFKLNGHDAFVILPPNATANTPWVWYAPTLKGLPATSEVWMFERFVKAGVAIAGIDVGESFGSPDGRKTYTAFYQHLIENKHFNPKPVLLARSRGGLMLYNWAAENPQRVGGITGIYPVCNIASYPTVARACSAYGMTAEQLTADLKKHNPIDRLAELAQANVPIFHIHGDVDKIVPLELNSGEVAKRYKQLGGEMTLEVVAGQGHNMWQGWFKSDALVKFAIANATKSATKAAVATDSDHPVPPGDLWLTYGGNKNGPGVGKHVVLIAAEQEYRSEQAMPMLAKVLSQHHGFDCTVLFSVNEQGEVDPTLPAPFKDKTKRHNIPGLEHLAKADCVIWLSRFMQLPDDQVKHFHDYFDSGKPLIALRTANHGFYGRPTYTKDGRRISLREMLGGTFMGHHGGWHREATSGIIVPENKTHPILTGVTDIWGTSDVYRCHNEKSPFPKDCTALVMGQPMTSQERDAPANEKKEPLPIAWTKTWTGNNGKVSKIFHFTMGSAIDFSNEGVRRLTVNGVYWGLGMEEAIKPNSSVLPVGEYRPLKSGFNYEKLGVKPRKPSDYK